MIYRRKSSDALVEAVQWEPGLDHPAITREYPPDRGHPGGWANVIVGGRELEIHPCTWIVWEYGYDLRGYTLVGAEAFADEYEIAPGENPPPPRTCWIAKFAGVVDAPCGEDCAAWVGGCGLLAAVGALPGWGGREC